MVDQNTKEQCLKILTYGMCLDLVQASAVSTKKNKTINPKNVNVIYNKFTSSVLRHKNNI